MNPVNNGLEYPIIRNRNFAPVPVGRMGLDKLRKPVGRMGLMNNGFNNFTSVKNSGILPSKSSDWVRMVGFATSLPAHSSDWVRPAPVPQLKQMAVKAGFSSSLPAQGTTYQGKGWA